VDEGTKRPGCFFSAVRDVNQADRVVHASVDILDGRPVHHPGAQRLVEDRVDGEQDRPAVGVERAVERRLHGLAELLGDVVRHVGRVRVRRRGQHHDDAVELRL
jgi:hypothetical protein